MMCLRGYITSAFECQISVCRIHAKTKAIAAEAVFFKERREMGDFKVRPPHVPIGNYDEFLTPREYGQPLWDYQGLMIYDPNEDFEEREYPEEIPEGNL
jgi:hypothetical protein